MKNFTKAICGTAIALCVAVSNAQACTGVMLKNSDDSVTHGRTLEFAVPVDTQLAVIPRNYEFVGKTPSGDGLKYKSKYAAVGIMAFNNITLLDSFNEKGLSVGTFYFAGYADYAKITPQNQKNALAPTDFANWIATQFANVEEVKKALEGDKI
ncbi:MAG: hypothetical protein RL154_1298, partial [Pseudomonadota bacterium]